MTPTRCRLSACLLVAALLPAPPSRAAPDEELLRFVPADATFCLVLRDLRGHAAALHASPLAERLRASPLGAALQGTPEWQQLDKVDQFLEKSFRLTAEQLRDDILGDAVVLAYRSGPPGRPEQEQGLLLVRARDPEKLAALVDRVNQVFKESGDLKLIEERQADGVKYFRRVERKEVNFYHLRGHVLAFSGQEDMLRRAIAQERKLPADKESPVGTQLRQLGADRALWSAWLNPRSFDAALQAKLDEAKGAEAAFLKTFVACWKALDGAALTIGLGADVEAGLTVKARPEALPEAVRAFLGEAAVRSDVWARFPDTALLALGSRTHAPALLAMLGAFLTPEAFAALKDDLERGLGAALDKSAMTGILPHVGPDWGLCVTAPPRADKAWFPAAVFALRVGEGDKDAPVDRALVDTLQAWARVAVLAHNLKKKELLGLKTLRQDGAEVHYVASASGQAMGLQPAFGLSGGYLILASTPEAWRRFAAAPAATPSGEVPLLRLSLKDLRQFLAERREPLTTALAEHHGQKPEQAGQNVDQVAGGLAFLDRVELVQKTAAGRLTMTLRLRTSLPLRK